MGPAWSPTVVEWVVELGTIGADPMREASPPHLVRCFLVELFLGSSSTFHNDRSVSEQNLGHVLVCSFHSYNGRSAKPMFMPLSTFLQRLKRNNLPRR